MREILFRGRRKKGDKRWVEGDLTQGYAGYVGIVKWCCAGTSFEVVPETVGQYTGLTDKNGRKIFEHDIVKAYDPLDKRYFIGVVKYFDASFYICDTNSVPCYFGEYSFTDFEVEVIGNVYDDVNLLEA